ncbi:MAG: hypothetical protein QOE70_3792 [Chthoniobacter sp.]|jgi:DNA-binding NarL/FixJ family response regulator|nr:hypothetical protein [Chthoniobacter sp.]
MVQTFAPSTPIKLLVVEDSEPVRRCVVSELREMPEVGEVVEAGDYAAALEALRAGRPDVVILDVQLPDGSGLEVLRDLRKGGAPIGVIIFSNLATRSLFFGCADLQPDFVFNKSADFEDVKEAVRLLGARQPLAAAAGFAGLPPR